MISSIRIDGVSLRYLIRVLSIVPPKKGEQHGVVIVYFIADGSADFSLEEFSMVFTIPSEDKMRLILGPFV